MEIHLRGIEAIDTARKAMAEGEVFIVLGRSFKVVEVTTIETTEKDYVRGVARLEAPLTAAKIAGYARIAGMRPAAETVAVDLSEQN